MHVPSDLIKMLCIQRMLGRRPPRITDARSVAISAPIRIQIIEIFFRGVLREKTDKKNLYVSQTKYNFLFPLPLNTAVSQIFSNAKKNK